MAQSLTVRIIIFFYYFARLYKQVNCWNLRALDLCYCLKNIASIRSWKRIQTKTFSNIIDFYTYLTFFCFLWGRCFEWPLNWNKPGKPWNKKSSRLFQIIIALFPSTKSFGCLSECVGGSGSCCHSSLVII